MNNSTLKINIEWSTDLSKADLFANLLFDCLKPDFRYISHSEVQEGRAISPTMWSADLKNILYKSIVNHLSQINDDGGHGELAIAWHGAEPVGLLQVSYGESSNGLYAILEDLVVRPDLRNYGIGGSLLQWLQNAFRLKNIEYIFLETGIHNDRAHRFFERLGYNTMSKVMILTL